MFAILVFLFVRLHQSPQKSKKKQQAKQAAEVAAAEAAALAAAAPKVASERELLEQIRDLLKQQKGA
jgi:large-conductance mechanosensitive channel